MGILEGLARFLTMQSSTILENAHFHSDPRINKCDFPDFLVLHPYFYGAYVWYKVSCACDIWLYSSMGVLEGLARFLTMQSSTISRECPFSQWSEDKCDFPDFLVLHRYFSGAYVWYKVPCACAIWLYSFMGVLKGLARFLTMQSSTIYRECPFSQWSAFKMWFPWFPRLAPILVWGICLIQTTMSVCHMALQFHGRLRRACEISDDAK